jgi:hypothetical protein
MKSAFLGFSLLATACRGAAASLLLVLLGQANAQVTSCDGCIKSHACDAKSQQCVAFGNCDRLTPELARQCYDNCRSQYESCLSGARNGCVQHCPAAPRSAPPAAIQTGTSSPTAVSPTNTEVQSAPTIRRVPRPAFPRGEKLTDGNFGPLNSTSMAILKMESGADSVIASLEFGRDRILYRPLIVRLGNNAPWTYAKEPIPCLAYRNGVSEIGCSMTIPVAKDGYQIYWLTVRWQMRAKDSDYLFHANIEPQCGNCKSWTATVKPAFAPILDEDIRSGSNAFVAGGQEYLLSYSEAGSLPSWRRGERIVELEVGDGPRCESGVELFNLNRLEFHTVHRLMPKHNYERCSAYTQSLFQ